MRKDVNKLKRGRERPFKKRKNLKRQWTIPDLFFYSLFLPSVNSDLFIKCWRWLDSNRVLWHRCLAVNCATTTALFKYNHFVNPIAISPFISSFMIFSKISPSLSITMHLNYFCLFLFTLFVYDTLVGIPPFIMLSVGLSLHTL